MLSLKNYIEFLDSLGEDIIKNVSFIEIELQNLINRREMEKKVGKFFLIFFFFFIIWLWREVEKAMDRASKN